MNVILTVLKAEWMKTRHTALPWVALLGGLFIPLVQGLIYLFRWRAFVPEAGSNGWDNLLSTCVGLSGGLLFPFLAIMLVAFFHHLEIKANAWKRLLVMPVGRSALYWGKWVFLLLLLLGAVLALLVGSVLISILLNGLRPSLELPLSMLPFGTLLGYLLRFYLSFLAILTLQHVMSFFANNALIPVMVGVFAYILSLVLVQGWSYAVYDPYAFPLILDWDTGSKVAQCHWLGLYKTEWLSLLYSIGFAWLGVLVFKGSLKR